LKFVIGFFCTYGPYVSALSRRGGSRFCIKIVKKTYLNQCLDWKTQKKWLFCKKAVDRRGV